MSQFLVLLHRGHDTFSRMSADEMRTVLDKYAAWQDAVQAVDGKRLDSDAGKVLRSIDGSPVAVDGPYSETKEVLGGYYAINASTYDEAVRMTLTHPLLEYGGTIELRKIHES